MRVWQSHVAGAVTSSPDVGSHSRSTDNCTITHSMACVAWCSFEGSIDCLYGTPPTFSPNVLDLSTLLCDFTVSSHSLPCSSLTWFQCEPPSPDHSFCSCDCLLLVFDDVSWHRQQFFVCYTHTACDGRPLFAAPADIYHDLQVCFSESATHAPPTRTPCVLRFCVQPPFYLLIAPRLLVLAMNTPSILFMHASLPSLPKTSPLTPGSTSSSHSVAR